MGILQARILEWFAMPSSRGVFPTRNWTQVSRTAGRFFTIWATRDPKNTGVGSLSLLQGNLPTQESNWGLRHCRQILYQLSYQGSPRKNIIWNQILKAFVSESEKKWKHTKQCKEISVITVYHKGKRTFSFLQNLNNSGTTANFQQMRRTSHLFIP